MQDLRAGMSWADISDTDLNIPLCLQSGQVFRWDVDADGVWTGAIGATAVRLVPERSGFWWMTDPPDRWDILHRFFSLDVDLRALYDAWGEADPVFAVLTHQYPGLRVLRQPAASALCSFICSSCNNVPRIANMVRFLAQFSGRAIETGWPACLFADPTLEDLVGITETRLRSAGFGYRARHVAALTDLTASGQVPGLLELSRLDWSTARAALMSLPGIGPKVADCIGLFGMGRHEVVPVDTHIHRFVVRRYRSDLAGKSLTPRVYDALAAEFRGIMGAYAGWAQQYVFMAARNGLLRTGLQGGNA